MAAVHGKNTKMSFNAQDISAYLNKGGISQQSDKPESTTFGKNSKTYEPGLLDGSIPLEGPFDSALHAILAPLINTKQAFVYQPNGATVGQPKATGTALLSDYEIDSSQGALSTIKATLTISDDVTWGVN